MAELSEWLATRPDEVEQLAVFTGLMERELAANAEKGDRPGWLTMSPAEAVAEVLYHAGKLAVAVRQSQRAPDPRLQLGLEEVTEYAADVANCALMVADIMGVLGQPSQFCDGSACEDLRRRLSAGNPRAPGGRGRVQRRPGPDVPARSARKYAPVGAIVYCAYWREHYTVKSHNADGTVTIEWHGDARCANPRPRREGTHRTPLDPRDRIYLPARGTDPRGHRKLWICDSCGDWSECEPGEQCEVCCEGVIEVVDVMPVAASGR